MVTMPKHVGVKELKNILAVNCAFVINIKPLMYQNACNELCKGIKIWPFCGYENWIWILRVLRAIWVCTNGKS